MNWVWYGSVGLHWVKGWKWGMIVLWSLCSEPVQRVFLCVFCRHFCENNSSAPRPFDGHTDESVVHDAVTSTASQQVSHYQHQQQHLSRRYAVDCFSHSFLCLLSFAVFWWIKLHILMVIITINNSINNQYFTFLCGTRNDIAEIEQQWLRVTLSCQLFDFDLSCL